MLPGFIHFDNSRGLRADALLAACAGFLEDHHCLRQALDQVGLKRVSFRLGSAEVSNIHGKVIHFYMGDTLLLPEIEGNNFSRISFNADDHELVQSLATGEYVDLETLKKHFSHHKLKPAVSALAIKVLENLDAPILKNKLTSIEAIWLFCHLLGLTIFIDVLDPKFISASPIYVNSVKKSRIKHALAEPIWINQVIKNLPTVDDDNPAAVDALASSFLKTTCGNFGPRGMSTIMNISIGHGHIGMIEALWCEAHLPASITECGPTNKAKIMALYEIKGYLKPTGDIAHIAAFMTIHGAQFFRWQLVQGDKGNTLAEARFIVLENDKKEALEAFLVKAESVGTTISVIEHHALNRRLASVPIGQGNKTFLARFHEYIYYEKVIRVEVFDEDLEAYIRKTNYSMDVARSDLLMAWKKWRGRSADEI